MIQCVEEEKIVVQKSTVPLYGHKVNMIIFPSHLKQWI